MSASPLPVHRAIASPCAPSIISLPFTSHVLLDDDEVGAGVVLELDVAAALVHPVLNVYRYVSLASRCASSIISLPFTFHVLLD